MQPCKGKRSIMQYKLYSRWKQNNIVETTFKSSLHSEIHFHIFNRIKLINLSTTLANTVNRFLFVSILFLRFRSFCEYKKPWICLEHAFYTWNQVRNWSLANIKHHESVPGKGIAKLKCCEQKTVYSNDLHNTRGRDDQHHFNVYRTSPVNIDFYKYIICRGICFNITQNMQQGINKYFLYWECDQYAMHRYTTSIQKSI